MNARMAFLLKKRPQWYVSSLCPATSQFLGSRTTKDKVLKIEGENLYRMEWNDIEAMLMESALATLEGRWSHEFRIYQEWCGEPPRPTWCSSAKQRKENTEKYANRPQGDDVGKIRPTGVSCEGTTPIKATPRLIQGLDNEPVKKPFRSKYRIDLWTNSTKQKFAQVCQELGCPELSNTIRLGLVYDKVDHIYDVPARVVNEMKNRALLHECDLRFSVYKSSSNEDGWDIHFEWPIRRVYSGKVSDLLRIK